MLVVSCTTYPWAKTLSVSQHDSLVVTHYCTVAFMEKRAICIVPVGDPCCPASIVYQQQTIFLPIALYLPLAMRDRTRGVSRRRAMRTNSRPSCLPVDEETLSFLSA